MKDSFKKNRKSRQRLGGGGGGLSLPAFVNAKSKPRLNPADVRKRREHYQNAKKIRKYRNLAKHLSHQQQTEESGVGFDRERNTTDVSGGSDRPSQQRTTLDFVRKKKKSSGVGRNSLEGLRQEFLKKKQEKDRLKAERLEALKAKEEAKKIAMQSRKDLKAKMFKRTHSGQPLMKHRLQHILESIQQSQ